MTVPRSADTGALLSATGGRLLAALEQAGPHPVLAWYGESSRIELSGHVLANWLIKTIGHLHDEIALEPGEQLVLDLPPHWKRLVLALAAWALGAEVTVLDRDDEAARTAEEAEEADRTGLASDADSPRVVATDRPGSALAQSADEVLALQAVSLAPRFDGELPPLAHDWLGEVRGSSDRLGVALPGWSGPTPQLPAETGPGRPRLLLAEDGLPAAPVMLGVLLAGGGIVGPAATVTPRQAEEESVTGRI